MLLAISNFFNKKKFVILLVLILLLGTFLRLYGIQWGLPNTNSFVSYKSDENIYIRSISQMNPSKLDFNPHSFFWGSWHFYELAFFLKLAHVLGWITVVPDKEFYYRHPEAMVKIFYFGRLLSVILSVFTIYLVYLIGKKIRNQQMGLLSAFLLAVMPAHVVNSHYLTADPSATFWVTWLLYFSIFILYSESLKFYILAGIALGLAAGSKYHGATFAMTILMAHLLKKFNVRPLRFLHYALYDRKLILAYAAALVTYAMTNPYMILAFSEAKPYLINLISAGGVTNVEGREHFVLDTFKLFSVGMTWPMLTLAILSLMLALIKPSKIQTLILLWLLPFTIHMLKSGLLATRFQMTILPGVCILIGIAVLTSSDFLAEKKLGLWKQFLTAMLAFSFFYTTSYVIAYDQVLASTPLQDRASFWLLENAPQGTSIGVASEPFIEKVPSIVHQDYFYPNTDLWKPTYRIFNIEHNVLKLRELKPEYFVITMKDEFYVDKKGRDNLSPFIQELLSHYDLIKSFERKIELFNYEFKPSRIILSDWHAPLSTIYILKRKV